MSTSGRKFIGIIPARYASTRFPGKPLALINGKPMIQHVYENASKALTELFVATDDERIQKAVLNFGGRVVMTSADHKSGTDRCTEAVMKAESELRSSFDAVFNIQGDEPFIKPEQIELLKSCFHDESTQIATLVKEIDTTEDLFNDNRPKVVISRDNRALYFSRSVIPFKRGVVQSDWLRNHKYYMHIGLYGFRREILPVLTSLPQSPLEIAESLEQLRWIENGFRITVRVTEYESYGIDTPADLENLLRLKH